MERVLVEITFQGHSHTNGTLFCLCADCVFAKDGFDVGEATTGVCCRRFARPGEYSENRISHGVVQSRHVYDVVFEFTICFISVLTTAIDDSGIG